MLFFYIDSAVSKGAGMDRTSIVFAGDIGFDHYMDQKWKDENLLDKEVLEFLHSGEHVCVNVEGALSNGSKKIAPNGVAALTHSMSPEVTVFLNKIKADIWNICNNHIMDAGPDGLKDTLIEAEKNGALTIGAGMNILEAARPVILDEAGGIGMFGVGYQRACRKADDETPGCFSWSDMERIEATIKEIKKTCRWCIVVAHGGEEFTSLPSPYTRKRYMDYLDMGADIVISHHPHVPMNYETFPGKAIFYSLGNFVFDTDYQRSQFNTEKGLLIRLNLTDEDFTFDAMGLLIDRDNERVIKGELPDIFEDVQEDEYELLEPLSAKAFISATKRQQIYLKPEKYMNATEEDWHENFYEPLRSGRVPGEALDMQIICPIASQAETEEWKKSKLTKVKEFILEQI